MCVCGMWSRDHAVLGPWITCVLSRFYCRHKSKKSRVLDANRDTQNVTVPRDLNLQRGSVPWNYMDTYLRHTVTPETSDKS